MIFQLPEKRQIYLFYLSLSFLSNTIPVPISCENGSKAEIAGKGIRLFLIKVNNLKINEAVPFDTAPP
jgi:hypothetical protein